MPLSVRWRYKLDRWRSQIAAMFHSEPKQLRPRLCPACGTLVGATATKCHQCGANMTFSFAAASRSLGRWMPQTSPVTYVVLAICCVMYALSFVITMKLSGGDGAGGGIMNLGGMCHGRSSIVWALRFHYLTTSANPGVRNGNLSSRRPCCTLVSTCGF